jgi:hypothetical protein
MFRRRRNSASFAVSEPWGKSRGKERHALGSKSMPQKGIITLVTICHCKAYRLH